MKLMSRVKNAMDKSKPLIALETFQTGDLSFMEMYLILMYVFWTKIHLALYCKEDTPMNLNGTLLTTLNFHHDPEIMLSINDNEITSITNFCYSKSLKHPVC